MKALITGASSGIGKDMAKILAQKGYHLSLVGRKEEELKKLQKELKEKNKIEVEIIVKDVSKVENCKEIHKKVKNVDILINNAGFGDCGNFSKTSLETIFDGYEKTRNRKNIKCSFYSRIYARSINGYLLCYKSVYCKNF